jgi:hypothetical protein
MAAWLSLKQSDPDGVAERNPEPQRSRLACNSRFSSLANQPLFCRVVKLARILNLIMRVPRQDTTNWFTVALKGHGFSTRPSQYCQTRG